MKRILHLSNKSFNVWDRSPVVIIEEKRTGDCFITDEKELSGSSVQDIIKLRQSGVPNPSSRDDQE